MPICKCIEKHLELQGHWYVVVKVDYFGSSLQVQWLGLRASTAGGKSSIPGRGTEIPRGHDQKKVDCFICIISFLFPSFCIKLS